MAFARKRELIQSHKPDLLILQECSEADILETNAPFKHWVGTNKHKGLGIIGYADHDYIINDSYTDELPWFIPVEIADLNLHVLAVWAHVKTQQLRYVRVTHEAVDHYKQFITESPTIITGDFNSNTIWDKLHPKRSHSLLVEKLHGLGLDSLYHAQTKELEGAETTPTLYMYRNPEKGYHIDFVFMTENMLAGSTMEIGKPEEWLMQSDHMPIFVNTDIHVR
jgi:endonuclease/exonuclease/phosphatase family metal-dependent hydrolase